jgi:hypothetical protein
LELWNLGTLLYGLGVVVGLAVMRDPWPARLGTALVWPLGPIAFVVVVSILLVSAVILWPLLLLPFVASVAALAWWLLT